MGYKLPNLTIGMYYKQGIIFLLSSCCCLCLLSAQLPLEQHRWQHRVLLLFAPDSCQTAFQQQLDLLTQKNAEVTDRHLVFYQIFTENGRSPDGKALEKSTVKATRRHMDVAEGAWVLVLIGKDGTEKKRWTRVTPPEEIFALIDAMPMRRAEMRRSGSY